MVHSWRFKKVGIEIALNGKILVDVLMERRIGDALPVQIRGALLRAQFHCALEDSSYDLPAFRSHAILFPLISRCSQTRAVAQCRFTVAADKPNTSAVSSIESPPKKRSSTMRLCCGSKRASSRRASSRASRSTDLPLA